MDANDIRIREITTFGDNIKNISIFNEKDISSIQDKVKSRAIEMLYLEMNTNIPIVTIDREKNEYILLKDPNNIICILKSFFNEEFALKDMQFLNEIEGKKFNELPNIYKNKLFRRSELPIKIISINHSSEISERNIEFLYDFLNEEISERDVDNYLEDVFETNNGESLENNR